MKDLVQFVLQQLVNHPEAVEVKETEADGVSEKKRSAFDPNFRSLGEARSVG
jgi:hypothetical protein